MLNLKMLMESEEVCVMESSRVLTWCFAHHLFVLSKQRNCLEYFRICKLQNRVKRIQSTNSAFPVQSDSEIVDSVFDHQYRLVFIIFKDGKVSLYQYISCNAEWRYIETQTIIDDSKEILGYRCCGSNGHLYWQTRAGGHNSSQLADVWAVPYHVNIGTEANIVSRVHFMPPKLVIGSCLPSDLQLQCSDNSVLVLPCHQRMSGIVLSITPVKVVVFDMLQGVIACKEHLLAPVQYSSLALPIMNALQAPQRQGIDVKHVVTDGYRILLLCSGGAVWIGEISDAVDGGAEGFSQIDADVDVELLELSNIILLEDILVFTDDHFTEIRYLNLRAGKLHRVPTGYVGGLLSWCYYYDTTNTTLHKSADVILLLQSGEPASLMEVLVRSLDSIEQSSVKGGEALCEPPTSISSLSLKLLHSTSRESQSPQLLDIIEGNQGIVTPFSLSLAKTVKESNRTAESLINKRNVPLTITSESIYKLIDTVSEDNVEGVVSKLTYYTDVAPRSCLSAFSRYLDPQGSSANIVEKVMATGSKYMEYTSAPSAPNSIVDSLLSLIDTQVSGKERLTSDRSFLLSYSKLCILSSCENRILHIIGLLKDSALEVDVIDKLVQEFSRTSSMHSNLINQYMHSRDQIS
ncbi:hypothetical protein EB796_003173 [Bugula neritina]|uniref:Uncharacterized protein n=1 Tax=Bugula neritina TaxID=10212 RepID=A0A7J7KLK1_BUGNE|nr:hypothetical protein EB796_003173 [Bugula neritina]